MRESLVAWAGDCQVRGEIDLGEGRLSDQVNEGDLLTFFGATLEAIEDGHQVVVDELEVERRELVLIEIDGHQGDPVRRRGRSSTRPARGRPFRVTGNLHRHPASQPFAADPAPAFVPVTARRSTCSTARARLLARRRPGEPRARPEARAAGPDPGGATTCADAVLAGAAPPDATTRPIAGRGQCARITGHSNMRIGVSRSQLAGVAAAQTPRRSSAGTASRSRSPAGPSSGRR